MATNLVSLTDEQRAIVDAFGATVTLHKGGGRLLYDDVTASYFAPTRKGIRVLSPSLPTTATRGMERAPLESKQNTAPCAGRT